MPSKKTSDEDEERCRIHCRILLERRICFLIYDMSYKLRSLFSNKHTRLTHPRLSPGEGPNAFQKDCHYSKHLWDCAQKQFFQEAQKGQSHLFINIVPHGLELHLQLDRSAFVHLYDFRMLLSLLVLVSFNFAKILSTTLVSESMEIICKLDFRKLQKL